MVTDCDEESDKGGYCSILGFCVCFVPCGNLIGQSVWVTGRRKSGDNPFKAREDPPDRNDSQNISVYKFVGSQ